MFHADKLILFFTINKMVDLQYLNLYCALYHIIRFLYRVPLCNNTYEFFIVEVVSSVILRIVVTTVKFDFEVEEKEKKYALQRTATGCTLVCKSISNWIVCSRTVWRRNTVQRLKNFPFTDVTFSTE